MSADNLLDHLKDDTIWKMVGTALMGLLATLIGAVKMLYNREHKAVDCLYKWKDEVVDPHISTIPVEYVRIPYCDRKHEEGFAIYDKRHDELIDEIRQIRVDSKEIRDILVKHLINGTPPPGNWVGEGERSSAP